MSELARNGTGSDAGKDTAALIYLLQLLGLVTGLTAVAAVIVNYVKWDDVRGTWLDSHFRWQVRTFWFTLLWGLIGSVLSAIGIGFLILGLLTVWYLYRVIRGWLKLNERREIYPLKQWF